MKLYFADRDPYQLSVSRAKKILFSYYYHSDKYFGDIKNKFFPNGVEVFLDSGGFTAMVQGVEIGIADYCEWLSHNKKYFEVYANLDVIGNQVQTRNNQARMENIGLNPIPVFHIGSGIKEFKRLCEEYSYVAIGGMVPYMKKAKEIYPFLRRLFDVAGEVKLHGFGCTNLEVLFNFPWFSIDSSTWLVGIKYGEVPIFDGKSIKRIKLGDWDSWRKNRRKIEELGFDWKSVASNRVLDKTVLLNLSRATFEEVEKHLTKKWGR